MNKGLVLLIFSWFPIYSSAQEIPTDVLVLSLKDVILMAREQSLSALQAETRKETSYWDWRTHRSNYNPRLELSGILPNYLRSFRSTRQPDGNIEFTPVSQGYSNLQLDLSQAIAPTGGTAFLSSRLERFDNFSNNDITYGGQPFMLGINQPILRYNALAWNKKIEPLRFEESKRGYVQQLENISIMVVDAYFNLLLAQTALRISQTNLQNNDTVYQITVGRYNLGKIGEDELLLSLPMGDHMDDASVDVVCAAILAFYQT